MRCAVFAFAAATIALSTPSSADLYSDYSPRETRRLAYDYAKCVVARHSQAASEALLRDIDNDALMRKYRTLIDGDCLVRSTHASAQMKFPGDLYRYALADALISRELATAPVLDPSVVPPLERRRPPNPPAPLAANASKAEKARYEKAAKEFHEAQSFRVFDEIGECAVRTNPTAAKDLLLTAPETASENTGFNALRPALQQCLPEGMTVSFGKLVLRGTVAVNYYRLAHAAHRVANFDQ